MAIAVQFIDEDMDDHELDIGSLIDKYENMRTLGKKIYFDADEFVTLAEYYNSGGDYDEAELLIEEGLRMHPGSFDLMSLKAKFLIFSAKYEEALSYLRYMSDESDPDQSLLKIEALLNLNNFGEAEQLIKTVLQQDLTDDERYYFLTEIGYILNDVEKFDLAIAYFEESLKIDDTNIDAIVDLAYAYEMKGDIEKSIEYNNLILDLDPYSHEAWVNIGKLYSMNEQYSKAIDSFDFALTIKEDDLSTLKMKALSLYLNDNVEEAILLFRQYLSASPNDEAVYDSLLEAYSVMEQYDEMMNIIDLKEEQFGSEGINLQRAFVYISKSQYNDAKSILSEIPEEEKDTFDYHMLTGELAFYENDLFGAENAFMEAAKLVDGDENVLDRLANINAVQEKYDQAAKYLEELLQLSPNFPAVKSRLAFIRFEIGSKEPFDEIIEQFSDDELRELLSMIIGGEISDFSDYGREKIITRLDEARENRVLFKNIKY